ncbi:hypothetical protein NKH18_39420 [Streptomyces sp. M10(2022)]
MPALDRRLIRLKALPDGFRTTPSTAKSRASAQLVPAARTTPASSP